MFPSGGRRSAYEDFESHVATAGSGDFVGLLVDSEDTVADIEKPWVHLRQRDKWAKPDGATDDQVLFMTTCMETWIAADRRGTPGSVCSPRNERERASPA